MDFVHFFLPKEPSIPKTKTAKRAQKMIIIIIIREWNQVIKVNGYLKSKLKIEFEK